MQQDLKQSHFSNQVKHQHHWVKWLGHVANASYALLFVASNVLFICRPDETRHKALYILLIVHLVYGYILLLLMGLLLLTTALASPFILTAFLYRKYHSHQKTRHNMVLLPFREPRKCWPPSPSNSSPP